MIGHQNGNMTSFMKFKMTKKECLKTNQEHLYCKKLVLWNYSRYEIEITYEKFLSRYIFCCSHATSPTSGICVSAHVTKKTHLFKSSLKRDNTTQCRPSVHTSFDDRQAELDLLCISILFLMKHSKRIKLFL